MTVRIFDKQPINLVTCKNCGTIHEFQPIDTKEGVDDGEAYRYITCLHCEAVIRIKPGMPA